MPKKNSVDKIPGYWAKMSDEVLPFLAGRRVAIEQMFGDFIMYHRHPKSKKEQWLYINDEADIKGWARKHAWSFHPHIHGKDDWWFVMDIDDRGDLYGIDLIREVAAKMARAFEGAGLDFLVKYSGNRGFHFMWRWDMKGASLRGKDRWEEAKSLVEVYAQQLENSLSSDYELNQKLRKKQGSKKSSAKFVVTNSQDQKGEKSILLDANILHENGNIRSPFSVHPETGLVSVPLRGIDGLMKFKVSYAERAEVIKKRWSWVEMPENSWASANPF